jgi:cyclic pyranopterin phosphate synthase
VSLKKTKIKKINISLDSLQRETFRRLSGLDELETVLEAIFRAQELGFDVKLNCVVMRGLNDRELEDFVKFSSLHQIPVRFLELMKIGVMARESAHKYFFSQEEMKAVIGREQAMTPLPAPQDSTSRNFQVGPARIGFIASETDEFCAGCSRLRVDASGKVYPCLFKDEGVSLRGKSLDEMAEILELIKNEKPLTRLPSVERVMHMIGG